MISVNLEIAKIVGTPGENSWTQVHTFTPEEPKKLAQRGHLLAVISLKNTNGGVETVALGREILARLHEEYFGNLEGEIFSRLKLSLEKVREEWPETEIVAGVILTFGRKVVLYAGILGQGKVLVQRKNRLTTVLTNNDNAKVEIGSGLVEVGDLLLLGTSAFFEIVGEGVLKAALNSGIPEEAAEALAPVVLGRTDLGQAAAVICRVDKLESISEVTLSTGSQEAEDDNFKDDSLKENVQTMPSWKSTLKKLKERILGIIIRLKPKNAMPRINQRKRLSLFRKTNLTGLVILSVLLLLAISFGLYRKNLTERKTKAEIFLSQAKEKLEQAKALAGKNDDEAEKLLVKTGEYLNEAEKTFKIKETELLQEEVKGLLTKTARVQNMGELKVFFDLGLIRAGAKAVAAMAGNNQGVFLDSGLGVIYFLDLEKQSSFPLADSRLNKAIDLFLTGDAVYILTSEGVFMADREGKKLSLLISKDNLWGEPIKISSFSGNIYLLDKQKKTILVYSQGSEGGFSAGRKWLDDSELKDEEPISFAIDGTIWVLTKDGKILKFSRGRQENFTLGKAETEKISQSTQIYTSGDFLNLYLLGGDSQKIVVLEKSGVFKKEYRWENKPARVNQAIILEDKKQVFLLEESLIYLFSTN